MLTLRMAGALILTIVASLAHGAIYKFVGDDGIVRYSNFPPNGKTYELVPPIAPADTGTVTPVKPPPQSPKLTKPTYTVKTVPLRYRGGVYELKATINGEVTVYFVVDSGAATVSISGSAARILIDNGSLTRKNLLGKSDYVMADGSTRTAIKVRLESLAIGDLVLHNVVANIIEDPQAPSLLGQSALQRFGKWNIDAANHTFTYSAP